MMKRTLIAVAAAAALGSVAFAQTVSPAIGERKAVLKTFGAAAGDIGKMVRGEIPFDAAKVKAHLKTLSDGAKKLPGMFPDSSKTGDTAALPKIWDEKAKVEQQLKTSTDYSEALKEITPTPPNVTLRTGLTIYRGTREIQLLYLGRGHTGGDVVVYLPKERVVATGDLLTAALSFMGDAYANEWPATLEALKHVDFDWVIPGHGQPYRGKANLENFQKYLEDFWAQASALHAKGISAEEAASQIDMTSHQAAYASITKPGVDIRAVQRAFAVMEGK